MTDVHNYKPRDIAIFTIFPYEDMFGAFVEVKTYNKQKELSRTFRGNSLWKIGKQTLEEIESTIESLKYSFEVLKAFGCQL
jgi:hypothetical protein